MNEENEKPTLTSGDCAEIAGHIVGKMLKAVFVICSVLALIGVIVGNRSNATPAAPVKVEQPAKAKAKAVKPVKKKVKAKAKKSCRCDCPQKIVHEVKIIVDTEAKPDYNLNIKSVEERLTNDAAL